MPVGNVPPCRSCLRTITVLLSRSDVFQLQIFHLQFPVGGNLDCDLGQLRRGEGAVQWHLLGCELTAR